MKSLTLSVIVPVYNEAHHIAHCLDALLAQSEKPDEIIVVNNNSTDDTVEIVKKYKQVKLVNEKKQGLIAARNKGLDEAKCDIVCRIDADAILEKNWTKKVKAAFMDNSELSGVTGTALSRVLPRLPLFRTRLYANYYFWAAEGLFGTQVMWGANMAFRRKFWSDMKEIACVDDTKVHEDQDLTLCLASLGGKIIKLPNLTIKTEGQVYHYFPKLREYLARSKKTRDYHQTKGRWPVSDSLKTGFVRRWLLVVFAYPGVAFFAFVSFLYWPFDYLMIKHRGDESNWLEKSKIRQG